MIAHGFSGHGFPCQSNGGDVPYEAGCRCAIWRMTQKYGGLGQNWVWRTFHLRVAPDVSHFVLCSGHPTR